ncbi:MAG: YdbL family protein [Desulfobacterales bacterium]|nr:YdbL family protein [Desulfobacterales bacterium]
MTHVRYKNIILFIVAAVFLVTGTAWSEGIKARMKQRLPVISDLKAKGIVGETNRGYLGFVGGKKIKADVVAAENKDRKAIYKHIAKQQNVSLELVEKRRAKILTDRTKKGRFFQNDAGSWIKK